jgi:hypothetical protein
MLKNIFLLSFLTLASWNLCFSQLGLHIYLDTNMKRPNIQIVDLKENEHGIFILGEAKDAYFKNPDAYFARVDLKGKVQVKKQKVAKVSEMKRIILGNESEVLLLGNSISQNGKPQAYSGILNKDGMMQEMIILPSGNSVVLGDAIVYDEKHALVIQAELNKETELFNVSLIKTPKDMFLVSPFAKIKSNYHELPSQVVLDKNKNIYLIALRYADDHAIPIVYGLKPDGTKIWEFQPAFSDNMEKVFLTNDAQGNLYAGASYRDKQAGTSWTELVKISKQGKELLSTKIASIKANGVLCLKNGSFLLYGTNYQVFQEQFIISKASFVFLDDKCVITHEDQITTSDSPDVDLPSTAMQIQPTSSEFNVAIQLLDGRIAFGGRIMYPENTSEESILSSPRYNKACILFSDEKGRFRGE